MKISIPLSAIMFGGFIAVFVLLDLFIPQNATQIRQITGIAVLIGYIFILAIWNVAAKVSAMSKRVVKLMLFLGEDKIVSLETFIQEISTRDNLKYEIEVDGEKHEVEVKSDIAEIRFEEPIEIDGEKYSRIIIVSDQNFESSHPAVKAEIEHMEWDIEHPYVYFIPAQKVYEIEESGEKILIFKSLVSKPPDIEVIKTVEARYAAKVTELMLQTKQQDEEIEILLNEPIKVSQHSKRVIRYFVKALVGAREAMDRLGEKPLYKDPWFWIVVSGLILITVIALDQAGIITVPKPW